MEEEKKVKTIKTEDTGKIFEMAICLAYNIPYNGKYKYGMEIPEKLAPRLSKLIELFPQCTHTAKNGSRYDFTSVSDENMNLSAKTTKKGAGKVAPQVIGQPQPEKFCEVIGTTFTNVPDLKQHIQTNIAQILPILVEYTFNCPNLYYNEQQNSIRYITMKTPIDFSTYNYRWTKSPDKWNNSSTLKIVVGNLEIAILEIQFHTKSRTNMAVRWVYENCLSVFKDNFDIVVF
jgi:hypothetical protein